MNLKLINLIIGFLFVALLVLSYFLGPEAHKLMFSESGVLENLQILAWFGLSLLAAFNYKSLKRSTAIVVLLIGAIAAMREADFQTRFTTEGFLKTNYYTNTLIPMSEKMWAGLIAFIVLTIVLFGIYRLFMFFLNKNTAVFDRIIIAELLAFLVLGKIADRLPNILKNDFDIKINEATQFSLLVVEEGGELLAPLLAILILWRVIRQRRSY